MAHKIYGQSVQIVSANINVDTQEKIVIPTTNRQEVMPDEGKYLSKVTVEAVTSTIDPNIKAGNIKNGVSILGVTGKLESGGGGVTGGVELNIAYGDTPPEDTSKLWINASEPEIVEVSPDVEYGEIIQSLVKAPFIAFSKYNYCCDSKFLYIISGHTCSIYDKNTLTLINSFSIANNLANGLALHDNILYFVTYTSDNEAGGAGQLGGHTEYIRYALKLCKYDLNSNTLTTLYEWAGTKKHISGMSLYYYNNKLYIVGGYGYVNRKEWASSVNRYYYVSTSIDVFDISTSSYTTIFNNVLCTSSISALYNNRLYLFGGYNSASNSSTMPSYSNSITILNLDTSEIEYTSANEVFSDTKGSADILGQYIYITKGAALYTFDINTKALLKIYDEVQVSDSNIFFNGISLYACTSEKAIKLQIDVPLLSTTLKIVTDLLNNQFALINSSSIRVMIGVKSIFMGDENNKAKEVDAYVYDETKFGWVNINTGEVILDDVYQFGTVLTIENATVTQSGTEVTIE